MTPCLHPLSPLLHRSHTLPTNMFHLFPCLGRRSKWQTKSPLQDGASQSQPKIECGKEMDVEAQVIDPPICCHFDLCSGDVSRLNSTTRSNNEGMSTYRDKNEGMSTYRDNAITGRYLLPFVTDKISLSLKLDSNLSVSKFPGHYLRHPSTQWIHIMTLDHRMLCYLFLFHL